MTVCIACLTDKSNAVVVASDRMITAGFLALQFEHEGTKIYKFQGKSIVSLTAGEATRYLEIFRRTEGEIGEKPNLTVEEIVGVVSKQYEKLRNEKIVEKFFRPMGLTRETFYSQYIRMLPEEIAMGLDKLIHEFDLGVTIIITGVDKTGAHIYTVGNPGTSECLDSIGYHSIGIGQSHSLLSLVANNASAKDNTVNSIYYVFEAKKRAENAPGVGLMVDVSVITSSGVSNLTTKELGVIQAAYDKINKPRKTNIATALKKLKVKDEK